MGLAGELTTIGLAEVFQNLAFNHLTGTLMLAAGEQRAYLRFEEGRVTAARVEGADFDFVEIARQANAAPEESLEKAQGGRRRTLKAFLRSAGEFDEDAYDSLVAGYVQETVLPLFGWTAASFLFEEGKPKTKHFGKDLLECRIELDPMGLAMEAARRHDEWEGIGPYVPKEAQILVPAGPRPEEVTPEQERLLELLDGTRTLGDVVKQAPLKKFEVFKAVAHLVETGVLLPATPERLMELAALARTAGRVTRATTLLETALEMDAGDLEARRELVRLYERSGRKVDAAGELVRLAQIQQERGDVEGALESYERAHVLAPTDLDTLEKVFETHQSLGNTAQAMKAGRGLAEALVAQEMYEDALPLYERLLETNDRNVSLRESLARCLEALGQDREAATQLLLVANRAYDAGEFEQALRLYKRATRLDPECAGATARVEEIESGAAGLRQARRARRRWTLVAGSLLLLVGVQGAREWTAAGALHAAHLETAATLARDNSDGARAQALARYAAVAADHGWTRAGAQARDALNRQLVEEIDRAGKAVDQARDARTTADVDFSLGRARKILKGIAGIDLPPRARERFEEERDALLRRVEQLKASVDGG